MRGHPRPPTLKATLCYEGGWLAEGEISYAGPNAAARARLAARRRARATALLGHGELRLRADLIGVTSVLADDDGRWWEGHDAPARDDVRLRVAAACTTKDEADAVVREVLALYTCGPPAAAACARTSRRGLASDSCFVPREWLQPRWSFADDTSNCTPWRTPARATRATARRICVIAYDAAALAGAGRRRSPRTRVAALFAHRRPTSVQRYLLPKLHAMNFVLDDVLDGGVNGSLNLDTHGKCLSSLLLTLPITLTDTKETP